MRKETGVIKFGDDWPGIFIRGDEALSLATKLEYLRDNEVQERFRPSLDSVISLLRSCRV